MDDLTSLRWFRRRRVGFGWRPVSWQGWSITLLAVAAAVVVVGVAPRVVGADSAPYPGGRPLRGRRAV